MLRAPAPSRTALRAASCALALLAAAPAAAQQPPAAPPAPSSPPPAPTPGPSPAGAAPQAPAGAAPQVPPGYVPPPGMPPGYTPAPMPGATPAPFPGYAPYPYAPPPGAAQGYYAQPYYYGPQMTVLPPATLPYTEGEPVPQGYEIKARPVRAMVIGGAVTFGAVYVVSVLASASLIAGDSSDNAGFAPLFIPVAGPFVTIGTAHSSGVGTLWLTINGLSQTAGATLLIYGLVARENVLQRTPISQITRPEVLLGAGTTTLRWHF